MLGTVVQLFYKIPETLLNVDINTYVSERDRVIRDRASAFDGKPCGTTLYKMGKRRRDLDFAFPTIELAKLFRKTLKDQPFFVHKHLRIDGEFVPKPTDTGEIQQRRAEFLRQSCVTRVGGNTGYNS